MLALFTKRDSTNSYLGRHRPEYVAVHAKERDYGHTCTGEECRCWGPTVALPDDKLTESFFIDPIREMWTEAETHARELRNSLVNPWKETEDAISAVGAVRWGV